MEEVSVVAVPLIVAIVYGALTVYKNVVKGNENLIRIIPLIAIILGAILGIVAFYTVPGIVPADNVLRAILIGGCSGLASTGTHQVLKVFTNVSSTSSDKDDKTNDKSDSDNLDELS